MVGRAVKERGEEGRSGMVVMSVWVTFSYEERVSALNDWLYDG